ncbi:MAG: 30S ribosomal protein S16 [Alphaproteobacteria bacterium]|jgi:small subunit ribosomal protein S16|nr:30S ribosomal protein S16 [Alphaproteobacteria bacterium]
MAVVIRMSRGGRRNLPFYRIVVADSRFPRDGRYIERVGTYNPLLETGNENRVTLVKDRIEHWLKQGAKPSERVAMFLGQAGMIDMPKQSNRPEKSAPGEKAKSRLEEKAAKKAAAEEAAKAPKEAPAPEAAPAEAPAEAANEAAPPAEEAAAG